MDDFEDGYGPRPNINYSSPEWAKVEEWLADELLHTYKRIASPALDERDTQFQRGRASMIETMLEFRTLNDVYEPR